MFKKILAIFFLLLIFYMNGFCLNNKTKKILDNGIVFIHNHNDNLPVVVTFVFVKMGAIFETEKNSGISNLVQTVILKGTKNRSAQQIAEEIEVLGGSIDSDSDYDFSTLSVAVGKQHFEKSIELLSDIFFNPIFPEEEIRKEKNNIIAEISAKKDHIFDVAYDNFLKNFYGDKHPYSRISEGSIKSIKRLKRQDLISWWKKFYGIDKNNIVIVISGDIDFISAEKIINKYFKDIWKTRIPEIRYKDLNVKKRNIKVKTKFQQGYLIYGYKAPSVKNTKDFLSLKIFNLYLGGGMSGKLFEVLREENFLCYETNSFYPTRFLDSHFVLYAGLDHERMELAKAEIKNIISQILENKIFLEKDLEEIKLKFKGRYILDHQTNAKQAWYLGFWEIMGLGFEYDERYICDVESLTLEDVRKTVKEVFISPLIIEFFPK